ncbi:MAG TPA: hypothetical protein VNU92_15325 [Edaphobacter sp.]|jgi:type IV pilus assembly protein PilO|nr:hypothetical protein [Edaphobacter sp.]
MTTTVTEKKRSAVAAAQWAEKVRKLATLLNLHIAGVVLLGLVNLYFLVHVAFTWRSANGDNAKALADQTVQMKAAEIARQPLEGLDAKLAQATKDADKFSQQRLPYAYSEFLAELGTQAKKQNVKLTRAQYAESPEMDGTPGALTEVRMDAGLNGDYRSLVMFINGLERDKMFFLIRALTLTGQQSGMVGLRLGLTTYERAPMGAESTEKTVASSESDKASDKTNKDAKASDNTVSAPAPGRRR